MCVGAGPSVPPLPFPARRAMNEDQEKNEPESAPTESEAALPAEMASAAPDSHEAHDEAEAGDSGAAAAAESEGGGVAVAELPPASKKRWYVVKVQSGREESIKNAIERRIKIEGLEEF